ncbi:MAG: hypothetical protein RIR41_3951 [Pseudomonadota bacterium]|jgi:hypothetical protein
MSARTYASPESFRQALEALRETLRAGRASPTEILRAARVCRVSKVMRPYMETLL